MLYLLEAKLGTQKKKTLRNFGQINDETFVYRRPTRSSHCSGNLFLNGSNTGTSSNYISFAR